MNLNKLAGAALVCAASLAGADLFRDDFSRFPPGWLTSPVGTLNGAIQEYHYLPDRGVPLGPWENAIAHLDSWMAGDENGKPYLEQHLDSTARQFTDPILMTGDPEWGDYSVEVKVKPLALAGMAGVVFRYQTNRHYYIFGLTGGNQVRLALHLPIESALRVPAWKELGRRRFPLRHHALLRAQGGRRRERASAPTSTASWCSKPPIRNC